MRGGRGGWRGGDRWGDIYAGASVKKMIALYDYDPMELSPNVDMEVSIKFRETFFCFDTYVYPCLLLLHKFYREKLNFTIRKAFRNIRHKDINDSLENDVSY